MMAILTEGTRTAEFLVSEANDWRSRDEVTVTVPASTTLESGTILGRITTGGKFVRHSSAAVDGSQAEKAVLFQPLVNTTAGAVDYPVTIIARDAEVNGADLTYQTGATAAQITTSNAALAALGVVVR